jgi:hypothetical protein
MRRFVTRLLVALPLVLMVAERLALAQSAAAVSECKCFLAPDRLKVDLPRKVALGISFDIRITPPNGEVSVLAISMIQVGLSQLEMSRNGGQIPFDEVKDLPIVPGRNGQTGAKITPTLIGTVHFRISARFSDGGLSVADFTTNVDPPVAPPRTLFADRSFFVTSVVSKVVLVAGQPDLKLRPIAFFDSVPGHVFDVKGWATYRLLPGEGPPVVALTEYGTASALGVGTAMAEVSFAGATSRFPIEVMAY